MQSFATTARDVHFNDLLHHQLREKRRRRRTHSEKNFKVRAYARAGARDPNAIVLLVVAENYFGLNNPRLFPSRTNFPRRRRRFGKVPGTFPQF